MVYYTVTKIGVENAQKKYYEKYPKDQPYVYSQERHNYFYEVLMADAVPMLGKRKADLVKEGASILARKGETSGFVFNITKDKHGSYYENQSWFILKEDGQWFFKMSESVKAKHLIEGVIE